MSAFAGLVNMIARNSCCSFGIELACESEVLIIHNGHPVGKDCGCSGISEVEQTLAMCTEGRIDGGE
jgi:hypothetical protein